MNRTELLKIAKPILFNTEMVREILDGRKTVTRRVINKDISNQFDLEADMTPIAYIEQVTGDSYEPTYRARYQPGDYLYVRETFFFDEVWGNKFKYKADYYDEMAKILFDGSAEHWHPSIHMPKEAARIFLKVTGVRVERLQDITDEQAKKEGMRSQIGGVLQFKWEWDLIYGNWSENPWVWVYEFERAIHDA